MFYCLGLVFSYNYATPKSFLELISFYQGLLAIKRGELNQKKVESSSFSSCVSRHDCISFSVFFFLCQDRLEKGLNILRATAADVGRLKEDLQVCQSIQAEADN